MKELVATALIVVAILMVTVGILRALTGESKPAQPTRYIDKEAGVICYTYREGISCVPNAENFPAAF